MTIAMPPLDHRRQHRRGCPGGPDVAHPGPATGLVKGFFIVEPRIGREHGDLARYL